jgi:hypothetical protein
MALRIVSSILAAAFCGSIYADTILDTLGTATSSTVFSVFGSAGQAIGAGQTVGPGFTLTGPTLVTEIGGFLNDCAIIIAYQPDCPNRLPFLVEILPSKDGVPDTSSVPFVFTLPLDSDPLTISYESVDPNLLLQAGNYFALFESQGSDAGGLLGNVLLPDGSRYVSGQALLGFTLSGRPPIAFEGNAAVRILGAPVPEPPSRLLLMGVLLCHAMAILFRRIKRGGSGTTDT